MATYIQVLGVLCFLLNISICKLEITSRSEVIHLSVPHNASAGYLVTKIGCSSSQINIQPHGVNNDEFNDSFVLTYSGMLNVNSDMSKFVGKSFQFTVTTSDSCHSNIPSKRLYNLHIQHSSKSVHFPQRFYSGFLPKDPLPGTMVKGLYNLQIFKDKMLEKEKFEYELEGEFSKYFSLEPVSRHDVQEFQVRVNSPFPKSKNEIFYFAMIILNGKNVIGHTNIQIIMIDHNHYDNLPIEAPHLSQPMKTFVPVSKMSEFSQKVFHRTSNNLAVTFDQNNFADQMTDNFDNVRKSHFPQAPFQNGENQNGHFILSRSRRQIQELPIDETKTGVLFSVPKVSVVGTDTFEIVQTDSIFNIDANGDVRLNPDSKLDYEGDPPVRTHELTVKITTPDGTVVNKEIRIQVRDINDEVPVFTNRPMPMLATAEATVAPLVEVYRLSATDADQGSEVRFYLEVPSQDFDLNELNGAITTKRNLNNNQDYRLNVYARDVSATNDQRSVVETVSILTGNRPPQFYETRYYGSAPENTRTDTSHRTFDLRGSDGKSVSAIEVKNFQNGGQIIFTILEPPVDVESNELEITPDGHIVSKVSNLDYETKKTFEYIISAKDSESLLQSRVSLTINILDVNEYDPEFGQSTYKREIPENYAIGRSVLEVMATDQDADQVLTYTVSDPHFRAERVGNRGVISVNQHLDYDRNPTHRYTFSVFATDNGTAPIVGRATIEIKVINVNDEAPIFDNETSKTVTIKEDKPREETVIIVKAVDIYEGDGVTHAFPGGSTVSDIFTIDPTSGKITLNTSPIGRDKPDQYKLTVFATDNGACCSPTVFQTSSTTVTINIVDAENTKPVFTDCGNNNLVASVLEEQDKGEQVIQILATDNNRGENGVVEYFIRTDQSQALSSNFTINKTTGWITTKAKIDRESLNPAYAYVTVMAQDRGQPPANNWCTVKIDISDINDNPPVIRGAPVIQQEFPDTAEVNDRVYVIRADDKDAGPVNNDIEYTLVENPGDFFQIGLKTGVITIKNSVTAATVSLVVMAQDRGDPRLNSTARVDFIKQTDTSQSPIWEGQNVFSVNETVPRTYTVATLRAISNIADPAVYYSLLNSSLLPVPSVPPFIIRKDQTAGSVSIEVNNGLLDYETKTSHLLTLRATNGLAKYKDLEVTINVLDTNDEIPRLTGFIESNTYISASIRENQPANVDVRSLLAVDKDITSPYNLVKYYILDPNSKFYIDELTGLIKTRETFDREEKKLYNVQVLVKDGAISAFNDLPNNSTELVKIEIEDENDNNPYFEFPQYNTSVSEDKPLYFEIVHVEAKDPDDTAEFTYTLEQNGIPHTQPFNVKSRTGWIYVSFRLDYETDPNVYDLTLRVSDGPNQNSTRVRIEVTDVNDETPVFDQETYVITNIIEEDVYSRANGSLVKVTATDTEFSNRPFPMEYQLDRNPNNADFINLFEINQNGELFLIGKLDRDLPDGREVYQFDVKAIDDGPLSATRLTGYATVRIVLIDINDNSPEFRQESLTGYVKENQRIGTSVMVISAVDHDAGNNAKISYRIGTQSPSAAFNIHVDTGEVTTTTDQIDRETVSNYTFEVVATDGGDTPRSTTATATVIIKDVNDNPVTINPDKYSIEIPETHTQIIMTFKADDPDIDDQLYYQLIGHSDKFAMTSRSRKGELSVFKELDYEAGDEFFSLTAEVDDGDRSHKATFYINITILDVNDEIPEFTQQNLRMPLSENTPVGQTVVTFTATDRDAGPNGEIEYFISRKSDSDPNKDFAIGIDNGEVTVRSKLDRETTGEYQLKILAIDKGDAIRLTGTATLTLDITDVNDEHPRFKENYQPVIPENSGARPSFVTIYAIDRDAENHGPPFGFELVCAPSDPSDICDSFTLSFDSNGDNGKGTAAISSTRSFDYEKQKYYYLPIKMWDLRNKPNEGQTGTNTLTVTIGNLNDNDLSGGATQDIMVYNYKGLFKNIIIGRVNYQDPDGWEIDNNLVFTLEQREPGISYFSVDPSTGEITMKSNVPSIEHLPINVNVQQRGRPQIFTSQVKINITDLPEEAPYFSGSMRLSGTTPEEFILPGKSPNPSTVVPSPYRAFRQKLADLLGNKYIIENVQIISVLSNGDNVDVRFSAHGSPYFQPSQLEGIVSKNKNAFQSLMGPGAEITTVSINECLKENCEGGCFNEIDVTGKPNLINAPGASKVGVETLLHGRCGCRLASNTKECTPDYCYNGGTCVKDYWGVLSCQCPSKEFNGPRCQQTIHGFDGIPGQYALYKTLEQCENSITSIQILTTLQNGSIYYNGPVENPTESDPTDFIALQLRNGRPELLIDHGSGSLTLTVPTILSDGSWHQIDVTRNGKEVTMTVDFCKNAPNVEGVLQNRSSCEARGFTPGENIYINVDTALQFGGRMSSPSSPPGITTEVFKGCVRDFRHNNELYDLYTKGVFQGGHDGCLEENSVCKRNDVQEEPKCEPNGECRITQLQPPGYECICYPGYRGDNCETKTTVVDFEYDSYMVWNLVNQPIQSNRELKELKIQLSFRSRDQEGLLYHISSTSDVEFIRIQIQDYNLELQYNLGDGRHNLTMHGVNASDGQWHTAKVDRHGKVFIMTMDGGEGLNLVQTHGPAFGHQELDIKNDQIYAGADLLFTHDTRQYQGNDLSRSCYNDIKLQSNIWFPMDQVESDVNRQVKIADQSNIKPNCVRDDCSHNQCKDPFVCRPLWGDFDCVCKLHFRKVGITCVRIDYCNDLTPCLHGTCTLNVNNPNGFVCACDDGWTGDLCNRYSQRREEPAVMAAGIIVGIIAAILIALLLVALLVWWLLRRNKDEDLIKDEEKEDYDIRENIVAYDDDGAGEEDNEGYDINRLRKPVNPGEMAYADRPNYESERPLKSGPPGSGIGDFIDDRLGNANDDPSAPPHDTMRDFDYEGGGSDAGSLSSLNTSSSGGDQDYDYLNDWGPKFAKLADMYNQYDELE